MITTSAMPKAKRRKTRTRTKQVSNRPAIVVTKLLPTHIDLLPGTASLVCPDCETWCPITGLQSDTPKLVPHHTGRAESTVNPRRCSGSNRRIQINLTIPQWRESLADAIKETSSRRATNVLRKPKAAVTPAVSQILPVAPGPETARTVYRSHVKACPSCTGRDRCAEGQRLAATFVSLERSEPRRREVRAAFARERARFDRGYVAQAAKERASTWDEQTSTTTVKRSELAKRAGTTVEEQNNVCKGKAPMALSDFRSPGLPLAPPDVKAHDQRQAELGKQYAVKKSQTTSAA